MPTLSIVQRFISPREEVGSFPICARQSNPETPTKESAEERSGRGTPGMGMAMEVQILCGGRSRNRDERTKA
jgi:hypothetical protein